MISIKKKNYVQNFYHLCRYSKMMLFYKKLVVISKFTKNLSIILPKWCHILKNDCALLKLIVSQKRYGIFILNLLAQEYHLLLQLYDLQNK